MEVVNLQRNWQKMRQMSTSSKINKNSDNKGTSARHNKSSDSKGKQRASAANIELTYYTLSGKEVNVRDEHNTNKPLSLEPGIKKASLKT